MYRVVVEGLPSRATAVAVSSRPWAPGVSVRVEDAGDLLDEAYRRLQDLAEGHDAECAYRCVRPGCRDDHACAACDAIEEVPS